MPSQRARNVSAVIDRLWAEAQSPEAKAEVQEIAKRANTDYGFWKKIADGPQMPTLGWGPEIGASVVSGGIAQKVPSLIGKRLAALPMAIYGAGHLGEGLLRRFEGLPETGEQILRGGSELAFGLPGLFPGMFKQTAAKAADNIPTPKADDIPTPKADDIPTPRAADAGGGTTPPGQTAGRVAQDPPGVQPPGVQPPGVQPPGVEDPLWRAVDRVVADAKKENIAPFTLGPNFAKAQTNFGFGQANFNVKFESELERALYMVGSTKTKSKRDKEIVQTLMAYLGQSANNVRRLGQSVRARIKKLAEEQIERGNTEGTIEVQARIPTSVADDIPASVADDIPTSVADDIPGRAGRGAATGRPQPPTPASPERIATIRGRIVETARQGRLAELDNFISQYAETVEAFTPEDITAFTTLVNKISPVSMSRLLRREQWPRMGHWRADALKAIDDLGPDRLTALRQPKEIQREALRSIKGKDLPSGGLLSDQGTITRESAGQYLAEAGGLPPELIQTMSDDELFETAGVFVLDQTEYLHSRVKKLLEKLGYGGGTSQNIWKYQGRHTQAPFQKIVETDKVLPKSLEAMGGREIPTEFGGDRSIGYLAQKFKSSFLKATEPGVKAGRLEMLARELQRVDLALALALLGLEGGRRAHVGSEGVANAAIG